MPAEHTSGGVPASPHAGRLLRHVVMELTADLDAELASTLYALLHERKYTEFAFEVSLAAATRRISLPGDAIALLRGLVVDAEVPAAVLDEVRPAERRVPATWIASRSGRSDPLDVLTVRAAAELEPVRRLHAGRRVDVRTGANIGPAYLIDFADDASEGVLAELTSTMCSMLRSRTDRNFSIFGRPGRERLCGYHEELLGVGDELWVRR